MPYFGYSFTNGGNGKKGSEKPSNTIPEAQEIKGASNPKEAKEAMEEKPLDIKESPNKESPNDVNLSAAEIPLTPNAPVNPQMYGMPQMPYMQNPPIHTCPYLMYSQMLPDIYNSVPFDTMAQDFQYGNAIRPAGDPPPVLSDNPPAINIVMFKELTGYPNYGNPSRNADILYTGNRGTWTFQMPGFQQIPFNRSAQVTIRAVLDDHNNVPVNRYSARITINERVVHNGPVPLDHGTPAGSMFTNWRPLTFTVNNIRRMNRITIENTSRTGPDDWMAFDWIEIRLNER